MNPTANTSSKKRRMRLPLYAAGGAVVGFISSAAITKLPSDLNWTLSVYYDYDLLFALIALAVLVMTIWNSISLARTPSARPEEDEADDISDPPSLMSPAERSLGSAMMLSTFSVITSFAWVALALSLYASSRDLPKSSNLFTLGNLVAACIAVIIVVVLQSVTIKRYNRYFPDRALDLNSRNMQKNHFEKLDEGEKWIVYRAAYRSFQMMNLLLGVGMAALVVYSILFSFAAFPIILLSVIWIINIGVYFRETYRAQKQ
ncbi:hypothetical protein J2T16_003415 [Paenibacillus intestini]|uniref:DUF3169 family protein n=1 Tax=Paenibacillus cucumis (ex Kampfer et al. 2016) TaxID=1776858 RepID=A0ABS7KGL9_9BACL|nr:DUF3169 family protein [Paenibacillus cucumis (ex Kampfer et al. 2016)]MBY0203082.1 DUF3169 family protein [Paenibacillus cucumis (ex Kampfer et al. 2016)]MDP9700508.1 hypothetical protein [Paenibacillus intestini]